MECSPPGSSICGIPRQENWSGLPFPSPEHLPESGIESESPILAGGFFTAEPPGKRQRTEAPGGLYSPWDGKRVGHDLATKQQQQKKKV